MALFPATWKEIERRYNNYVLHRYTMPKNVLLKKEKIIYFPIPKVACTSLLLACAEISGIHRREKQSVHEIYFPTCKNLEKLDNIDSYFKFAFVRNPWDRLVSCYSNKIKSEPVNNRWFKDGVSKGLSVYGTFRYGMTFEEFANEVVNLPDEQSEKHFRSQYTFLTDDSGNLLVDFVGKFKNLSHDLEIVSDKLGLDEFRLPHLQKSPRKKNYLCYYSKSLQLKIEKRYIKDIETFHFDF